MPYNPARPYCFLTAGAALIRLLTQNMTAIARLYI